MQNNRNSAVQEVFQRDASDGSVAVLDGYGLEVLVHHGHLIIRDGIGTTRRERKFSRAERKLRRIIVIGHTGFITFDAVRWCNDVGIAIHHLDVDGRVLSVSWPKLHDDARLRRAQATALDNRVGLSVARYLLSVKLEGQAANADALLNDSITAQTIRTHAAALQHADLDRCRDIESQAANVYFDAWYPHVTVNFAGRDQPRIPAHWKTFIARSTPLSSSKTARNAVDPINALLNYAYSIGEAETVLACAAVGLDAGLGVLHSDKKYRASLALDLIETVRPSIERYTLTLLQSHVFRYTDFHETRDGRCRVLAPLTHSIAANAFAWHAQLAPHAEAVAYEFANSSDGRIRARTPLTQANVRAAQRPAGRRQSKTAPATVKVRKQCRECGGVLAEQRRVLCPACAPADLAQRGRQHITAANARLAELRAAGQDPCLDPDAVERKRSQLRRNRAALLAWERQHPGVRPDPEMFARNIQPLLAELPISALQEATGLSESACSRIRSGKLVPHLRHWSALRQLGGS